MTLTLQVLKQIMVSHLRDSKSEAIIRRKIYQSLVDQFSETICDVNTSALSVLLSTDRRAYDLFSQASICLQSGKIAAYLMEHKPAEVYHSGGSCTPFGLGSLERNPAAHLMSLLPILVENESNQTNYNACVKVSQLYRCGTNAYYARETTKLQRKGLTAYLLSAKNKNVPLPTLLTPEEKTLVSTDTRFQKLSFNCGIMPDASEDYEIINGAKAHWLKNYKEDKETARDMLIQLCIETHWRQPSRYDELFQKRCPELTHVLKKRLEEIINKP